MKKSKIISIVLILMLTIVIIYSNIYAAKPTKPTDGTVPGQLKTTMPKIWVNVTTVVQFISVGCIVFAGVRYMFSSTSGKADVKSGLIYLVIGSIITFSTVTIIKVVTSII